MLGGLGNTKGYPVLLLDGLPLRGETTKKQVEKANTLLQKRPLGREGSMLTGKLVVDHTYARWYRTSV